MIFVNTQTIKKINEEMEANKYNNNETSNRDNYKQSSHEDNKQLELIKISKSGGSGGGGGFERYLILSSVHQVNVCQHVR